MQTEKLTPLMRQYWQIKSLHKDKLLFFRMGDFFEMFHEDAEKAAPILNITLTVRNKKASDNTKMCGVPHHSIAGPVGKLLAAGFKVAICDQVEPTPQAKGLVRREVTRVLTPGMVYDPESLDHLSAHYLCAFDEQNVSFLDISTGEAFFYPIKESREVKILVGILSPQEIILTPKQKEQAFLKNEWEGSHLTVFDENAKNPVIGRHVSLNVPVNLPGSGPGDLVQPLPSLDDKPKSHPLSAERLLLYVKMQQGESALKPLRPFQKKELQKEMGFSFQAQDQLEIFKNYKGDKAHSLFSAVNRTLSPSGARLLKSRLRAPCTDRAEIERRINLVQRWVNDSEKMDSARALLVQLGDVERKTSKVVHPQCHGRDLLSLAGSIDLGLQILKVAPFISTDLKVMSALEQLAQEVKQTIHPQAPPSLQGGQFIQQGVSEELDQLITETDKRQVNLQRLEVSERRETGIPSLKIRYNNVFGYYIEVTKAHGNKIPAHYIRKQTLTQAERYTTAKLQMIEAKFLSARARRIELETNIFETLRQKIVQHFPELFWLAREVSEVDLQTGFAFLAIEQSYTKPCFTSDHQLVLVDSRHPLVEQKQSAYFVPNTIRLKKGECLLLTGPNMAGKSTLMRQVALSVILAQAGSFIPASKGLLPIFKNLLTRIGAVDSLSEGLSTFMVEMKESVEILKKADEHSLIILDEIGRGTATYDGMSLAQALLEHLIKHCKSLVFFATHYHELTVLAREEPLVRNAHLSVSNKDGKIQFLYTLVSGALTKSYGLHVASLAGFPCSVIKRAKALLRKRERVSLIPLEPPVAQSAKSSVEQQVSLFDRDSVPPI